MLPLLYRTLTWPLAPLAIAYLRQRRRRNRNSATDRTPAAVAARTRDPRHHRNGRLRRPAREAAARARKTSIRSRRFAALDQTLSRLLAPRSGALDRVGAVAQSGPGDTCTRHTDGPCQWPAVGAFVQALAVGARADRPCSGRVQPVPRPR